MSEKLGESNYEIISRVQSDFRLRLFEHIMYETGLEFELEEVSSTSELPETSPWLYPPKLRLNIVPDLAGLLDRHEETVSRRIRSYEEEGSLEIWRESLDDHEVPSPVNIRLMKIGISHTLAMREKLREREGVIVRPW
jgi:hypothetical protein